ncbi:MAG: copper oxidase, partial [Actinomycetes bacterium]
MRRTAWHVRVDAIVLVWFVAEVVLAVVALAAEVPTWVLVHVLVLGVVSNAILIWSSHFAAAMLNLAVDTGQRALAARLVAFNAGVVIVIGGMLVGVMPLAFVGAVLVVGAVVWHAVTLWGWLRGAPSTRLGPTVGYYVAAGSLFVAGVAIGAVMASEWMTDDMRERLVLAHVELNVLGWVGLTLVGT